MCVGCVRRHIMLRLFSKADIKTGSRMIDAVRLATGCELPTAGLPAGERGKKKDVLKNLTDLRQWERALIKRL